MTREEKEPNEFEVLLRMLDIVKLSIEKREPQNYEPIQIMQIANQFLPGTVIGNFIEEHNFEQLGDFIMGSKYEAHGHAQIGAMGDRAKVTKVTFCASEGQYTEIDLVSLVGDLQNLRSEMRNQAATTEHDLAVVAVGQAISAAEEGDTSRLIKCLKSSGIWAVGLATSIGAGVAASAIKAALGL